MCNLQLHTPTQITIAHLDFWGRRQDVDLLLAALNPPFLSLPWDQVEHLMLKSYVPVTFREIDTAPSVSLPSTMLISLRYGKIGHLEYFEQIMGIKSQK